MYLSYIKYDKFLWAVSSDICCHYMELNVCNFVRPSAMSHSCCHAEISMHAWCIWKMLN